MSRFRKEAEKIWRVWTSPLTRLSGVDLKMLIEKALERRDRLTEKATLKRAAESVYNIPYPAERRIKKEILSLSRKENKP